MNEKEFLFVFRCEDCQEEFGKMISKEDFVNGKKIVICPHCNKDNISLAYACVTPLYSG